MAGGESSVDPYFPWKVVEQSLRDPTLAQRHGPVEEYLIEARSCPKCGAAPERLRWIYVREELDLPGSVEHPPLRDGAESSALSALSQCREGYLLVCDNCHLQVDFFCERRR
jgi:hypothetical protein